MRGEHTVCPRSSVRICAPSTQVVLMTHRVQPSAGEFFGEDRVWCYDPNDEQQNRIVGD